MNDRKSVRTKSYTRKFTGIYLLASVACIGVALLISLTVLKTSKGQGITPVVTPQTTAPATTVPLQTTATTQTPTSGETENTNNATILNIEYTEEQLGDGLLAIISEEHPATVPKSDELVLVKNVSDAKIKVPFFYTYLSNEAFDALNTMQIDMASATGSAKVITINEAYITSRVTGETIEILGSSVYCTGNAFDLKFMTADGSASYPFGQSPTEDLWIKENAWKYGLIFRYPADKTVQTGHAAKPSQMLYVGRVFAKYMYDNNFCLEELHANLKSYSFNSPLVISGSDGNNVRVYYVALGTSGKAKVSYRSASETEIYGNISVSGDGSDGFIVLQEYSLK